MKLSSIFYFKVEKGLENKKLSIDINNKLNKKSLKNLLNLLNIWLITNKDSFNLSSNVFLYINDDSKVNEIKLKQYDILINNEVFLSTINKYLTQFNTVKYKNMQNFKISFNLRIH